MHEHLIAMIEHADAFIALLGGLGTLEEIFTVVSWAQLKIRQKPIRLLNVNHYYSLLMILSGTISFPIYHEESLSMPKPPLN